MNKFEHVVIGIGKAIIWPFAHGAQLFKVVETTMEDEPKAKAVVLGLLAKIAHVTADGAVVVSGKGLSLEADLAELAAMKELWQYVTGVFIPEVKQVYGDVGPQIEALTASNTPAPSNVPQFGPGLHTVTEG